MACATSQVTLRLTWTWFAWSLKAERFFRAGFGGFGFKGFEGLGFKGLRR